MFSKLDSESSGGDESFVEQSVIDYCRLIEASNRYRIESIEGRPWSSYDYFVYPGKGFAPVAPRLEWGLAQGIAKGFREPIDLLVTIETDGIGIAKMVSLILDVPMIVARSFHYHQDVIEFEQKAAYHTRAMYLSSIVTNQTIGIIDAVVSSGGTARALIEAAAGAKAKLTRFCTLINKPRLAGDLAIRSLGVPFAALIDVVQDPDGVRATRSEYFPECIGETGSGRDVPLGKSDSP